MVYLNCALQYDISKKREWHFTLLVETTRQSVEIEALYYLTTKSEQQQNTLSRASTLRTQASCDHFTDH